MKETASKAHFVPSIQGLRGVAILLVIADHLLGKYSPGAGLSAGSFFHFGGIGVEMFFVLSGFLITGNLLREQESRGSIGLRKFYVNRAYRILPAFYVYLIAVAIVAFIALRDIPWYQLLASGTFIWNYAPATDMPWLDHTWSLSLEEQFYLLWPLGLILLKPKRALWFSIAFFVSAPAIRVVAYAVSDHAGRDDLWQMFHIRADSVIIGCLVALTAHLYPKLLESISARIVRYRLPIGAIVLILGSAFLDRYSGAWKLIAGYTVENVALTTLLLAALQQSSGLARVLRWRPLMLVGLISYSLYLWQQLFVTRYLPAPLTWLSLPGLDIILAMGFATASYLYIEKPFLALRSRRSRQRASRPEDRATDLR